MQYRMGLFAGEQNGPGKNNAGFFLEYPVE
jgi:hypothetical protein